MNETSRVLSTFSESLGFVLMNNYCSRAQFSHLRYSRSWPFVCTVSPTDMAQYPSLHSGGSSRGPNQPQRY